MSSHSRQALMPEEQNYVVLPQTQEQHSFLLTVDFEESFDWDEPSLSDHHSRDIEGMEKLHAFCVGRGIKPVYVVTYQVLESPQAAQFLAQALQRDECEVGIHLHAWNTPPLSDYDQTFQCDLPVAIEFEKLASPVALYRQVFDRQPLIHRAGRYGIDRCSFDNLAKLGLTIDLSPSAGFDFLCQPSLQPL